MSAALEPKPPFADGRDASGRFLPGNKGGPGNPHAAAVSRLRSALLDAISPEELRAVVKALVARAMEGDVLAAREVFDRLLGKPLEADILERLAVLEGDADDEGDAR